MQQAKQQQPGAADPAAATDDESAHPAFLVAYLMTDYLWRAAILAIR